MCVRVCVYVCVCVRVCVTSMCVDLYSLCCLHVLEHVCCCVLLCVTSVCVSRVCVRTSALCAASMYVCVCAPPFPPTSCAVLVALLYVRANALSFQSNPDSTKAKKAGTFHS